MGIGGLLKKSANFATDARIAAKPLWGLFLGPRMLVGIFSHRKIDLEGSFLLVFNHHAEKMPFQLCSQFSDLRSGMLATRYLAIVRCTTRGGTGYA